MHLRSKISQTPVYRNAMNLIQLWDEQMPNFPRDVQYKEAKHVQSAIEELASDYFRAYRKRGELNTQERIIAQCDILQFSFDVFYAKKRINRTLFAALVGQVNTIESHVTRWMKATHNV